MNSSKTNILFVTPGFAKNEKDSTCIPALQDFILGLNKYHPEISVTIVALHYPPETQKYNWYGNTVYSIGANNCSFPKRFIYWRRFKKLVYEIQNLQLIDLVQSFWYDEVSYLISTMKLDKPHYCTFMGQDAIGKNPYITRLKKNQPNIVAISDFQKNKIKNQLKINCDQVIPWGVLQFENHNEKPFDVINVGSFNNIKNQEEAVRIIKKVTLDNPGLKCLFIGDGPNLDSVKNLAKTLSISNNINFTGNLNRAETLKRIGQSKILLHSSKYESYGMVLAEAAVSGAMIVSKEYGVAKEKKWWKIYTSEKQAVTYIQNLLNRPIQPDHEELKAYTVKNTLEKYLSIWGIKKGRT